MQIKEIFKKRALLQLLLVYVAIELYWEVLEFFEQYADKHFKNNYFFFVAALTQDKIFFWRKKKHVLLQGIKKKKQLLGLSFFKNSHNFPYNISQIFVIVQIFVFSVSVLLCIHLIYASTLIN